MLQVTRLTSDQISTLTALCWLFENTMIFIKVLASLQYPGLDVIGLDVTVISLFFFLSTLNLLFAGIPPIQPLAQTKWLNKK